MSRFSMAAALGLAIGVIGVLSVVFLSEPLEEDLALPWLYAMRGPVAPPDRVAIVTIDKTAAQQVGMDTRTWPPPRHVHADVIRHLAGRGVSAILVDVFFKDAGLDADDAALVHAIASSDNVVLFERLERSIILGREVLLTQMPASQFQQAARAMAPFPLPKAPMVHYFWSFADEAHGEPTLPAAGLQIEALPLLGPFMTLLREAGVRDVDGLPDRPGSPAQFRQVMLALRRAITSNPAAAAEARRLLNRERADLSPDDRAMLARLLRLYSGDSKHYLNFYGPPGRIQTIPFHDLLRDVQHTRFDLTGKIIVVGEGASSIVATPEQEDRFRTVYSSEDGVDLTGAEIAATAVANLLTERSLQPIGAWPRLATIVGLGVLFAGIGRLLPGLWALPAALLVASALLTIAQREFNATGRLVPVAIPLLIQLPLGSFLGLFGRYRSLRRQVAREIDPHASPELADGVCLSSDIENYTGLSERAEPGTLASRMDEYYTTLSGIVAQRGGLMMGRAGDSAMCVWRMPRRPRWFMAWRDRSGQHARRRQTQARANACLAALDIAAAINRLAEQGHTRPLVTRMGLHVGPIALGPVGGEYHVVGDTPNTASRIEALNKRLGTMLLASEQVVEGVGGLDLRPLGTFSLTGKLQRIALVEILGRAGTVSAASLAVRDRFAAALRSWMAGDVPGARRLFESISADAPLDGPTRYYLHLCDSHESTLPPDSLPPPEPQF